MAMTGLLALVSLAAAPPQVVVNGLALDDAAVIRRGRVLVPMRPVFEALGASVRYDERSKVIVAARGRREVQLVLNEKFGYDMHPSLLDAPPQVIRGRVMVPLRFVSETLGATVAWDHREKRAVIELTPAEANTLHPSHPPAIVCNRQRTPAIVRNVSAPPAT